MIYALIIGLFLLLILSYVCSQQYLLSPAVMTCCIWLVCLSLYLFLPHNLYPLGTQTAIGLTCWILGLTLSSLFIQSFPLKTVNTEASKTVRDLYLVLSIATFPLMLWWAYKALTTGTGSWMTDLRSAAIGNGVDKKVFSPTYMYLWQVTYALELIYFERKKWWRVAIPAVFFIALGLCTMAKIHLLSFMLFTICILLFKRKISFKHLVMGIGIVFVAMAALQYVRINQTMDGEGVTDFVSLYLLSPMPAFETIVPKTAAHWGENALRFFYIVGHKLGLTNIEPVDALLPFVKVPISTNTYTVMYPFFVDFGYAGILIFAILLGGIYGMIFRVVHDGNKLALVIYAYLMHIIVMQYAADLFFTGIAGIIKLVLIAAIPFVVEKSKMLYR